MAILASACYGPSGGGGGGECAGGLCGDRRIPVVSENGRFVAFKSEESNLVAADTNGGADVFVRDTVAETTTRVSVASSGTEGVRSSHAPSISDDGRYVAFFSAAANLVPDDTTSGGSGSDVFVHDTATNTTTRVSVDSAGTEANGWSDFPAISADGRYVAFESDATNLAAESTNCTTDAFVRDTVAGTTTWVSVNSTGGASGEGC